MKTVLVDYMKEHADEAKKFIEENKMIGNSNGEDMRNI